MISNSSIEIHQTLAYLCMYLEYEEDGDPLIVGVVDWRVGVGAARAVPLEVLGDVEGAVHPAVVLQRRLTHPAAGL